MKVDWCVNVQLFLLISPYLHKKTHWMDFSDTRWEIGKGNPLYLRQNTEILISRLLLGLDGRFNNTLLNIRCNLNEGEHFIFL